MLEGKNVNLRLFTEDDLDEYLTLENKLDERGEHFPVVLYSVPKNRKEFGETGWWEDDQGRMLVTSKEGRMLGVIVFFKGFRYESGYEVGYGILRRDDRGHGYMSEALRIFSAYLFALKPVPRLQIHTATGNAPARRIAEKCGYKYEGTMRKLGFLHGEYVDVEQFSLLREECPALAEALQG